MCGRFALSTTPADIVDYFEVPAAEAAAVAAPRYNVTPGQPIAAVRLDRGGARRLHLLRWGLVPSWAKDETIGRRLVNARLETLASKPAFRDALQRRRCVIPATGFYEWQTAAHGKQPHFIRAHGEPVLAFAGLWERWRGADDALLETCVIVTTAANATIAPIHERMPLLLGRADVARWLDPTTTVELAAALGARGPALDSWPVGTAVNDLKNDDPRVLAPAPVRD